MKINDFVVAILLLLLSFVAFYNSFDNAFLMDDFPMLVENLNIGDSAFLQVDPSAKSQVYFRPVTHILNLITYTYFKENPIGYHCVNLLLYYAAALVFYFLIKKVFHNSWMAFGAAALFIVHPINGVCVNYKNATGDALLVLAINIALLRGLRAAQKNSVQNQVLGLIWLLVALGCHEIAFAFPFLFSGFIVFDASVFVEKNLVGLSAIGDLAFYLLYISNTICQLTKYGFYWGFGIADNVLESDCQFCSNYKLVFSQTCFFE